MDVLSKNVLAYIEGEYSMNGKLTNWVKRESKLKKDV